MIEHDADDNTGPKYVPNGHEGSMAQQGLKGISVVVPNWNGRDLLERCLESLMVQDYANFEVILVDNGSTDGSVDYVRANYPAVRVVSSHANLGYAGGCNLGASNAKGEYVLLLNNDTKLSRTLLSRLARVLDVYPSIAAVSGVTVEALETAENTVPRIPILGVTAKHFVGPYDPAELFYAPGTCVMYRRNVVSQPFDPDYFAYDEDVYLSWRLRLLGYDVAIDINAYFEHEPFSTSRRIKNYVTFSGERNRWTNLLIFYESKTLAKIAPLAILSIIMKLLHGTDGLTPKLQAYNWILHNLRVIRSKRVLMQNERVVDDGEITRHMTGAVAGQSSGIQRLVNRAVLRYLHASGIRTLETERPATREETTSARS